MTVPEFLAVVAPTVAPAAASRPWLMAASIAPHTRRAYAGQWRAWLAFAGARNGETLPAHPGDVAAWLLHRLGAGFDSNNNSQSCRRLSAEPPTQTGLLSATVAAPLPSADARPMARGAGCATVATGDRGRACLKPRPVGRNGSAPASGGREQREASTRGVATLRCAIAAIRFVHLAHGHPFESRHPDLTLVLRIAKGQAPLPRQAKPARAALVRQILAGLGADPRERRDAALIALGYAFALRPSELVALDLLRVGRGGGCLAQGGGRLEVRIGRSKRQGPVRVHAIPLTSNRQVARAVEAWVQAASVKPGEPLFRGVHRSGSILPERLTSQSVALILKARLAQLFAAHEPAATAITEARNYSGHSLRVGFAVTAAEAGATVFAVQMALGHATPAMATRYAQAAEAARTSPHHLAGVALNTSASSAARGPRRSA